MFEQAYVPIFRAFPVTSNRAAKAGVVLRARDSVMRFSAYDEDGHFRVRRKMASV